MRNSHNNIDPIIHNHRVAPDLECYLGSNRYDLMRVDGRCDGRVTIAGLPKRYARGYAGHGCSVMKRGAWLATQPREIEGGGTPRF